MHSYSEILTFKQELIKFWHPEIEQCGVIRGGVVTQTPNLAPEPQDNFEMDREDLLDSTATWHSHPSRIANLSIADYWFFKYWGSHLHFITSDEEVRCYVVVDGTVRNLDDEADHTSWILGRTS